MIKELILESLRGLNLSPQPIELGLFNSIWRISKTVPIMRARESFSVNDKEFWRNAAEEESGHDTLLASEIVKKAGSGTLIRALNWIPSPQMYSLMQTLMFDASEEAEILAGVYKAYLEMGIFEVPIAEEVLPYCRQFVDMHKELDVAHVEEAIAWLEAKNIVDIQKYINLVSSALEAESRNRG